MPDCQTYAVSGRSSSRSIARVSDKVAWAVRHDTPLAVISLDLKSALDTLRRSYLLFLLEKLGLPSTFLGWISVLYRGADATIQVGDVYSKTFPLPNGVKQGCGLSAALFSIGAEPLLRRLENILGRGCVVTHEDDTVLFIKYDAQFEPAESSPLQGCRGDPATEYSTRKESFNLRARNPDNIKREKKHIDKRNTPILRFTRLVMKKEVKRKVISLETKIEILDRLRKGDRVVDVAKSYSMNEATIRTIRTNENTIRKSVAAGITTSMGTTSYTRNIAMEKMEQVNALDSP
ncbi:hypothetical protein LAZ67_12001314 [Cordylochernes scorpioides]|uniref:Reverse transcriptase domain-containing protein n=1 Tax=Cordylochernes scorpioides TaxID=51811 RepID=A0ABY6L3K0_9ARAC|nr:hypothetical protein LAZ67_12001314 [Cordylochernes scorpioides]